MVNSLGLGSNPNPAQLPVPFSALKLLHRKVYWKSNMLKNGEPGWLVSEVASGPKDPTARASGITMQLKNKSRLDSNTPTFLLKELLPVAFNESNHGTTWYLLE